MKTVLAIGNPEEEYAKTRHNIGWMVADALAARWETSYGETASSSVGEGRLSAQVMAVNVDVRERNGRVVPELKSRDAEFGPDDAIVGATTSAAVGVIRIRAKGSSGAHNG
jgi:PTH1 family peptidyl-tRNA hydrolase